MLVTKRAVQVFPHDMRPTALSARYDSSMNINPSAPLSSHAGPSLEHFEAAARDSAAVYISVSGQSMQVLGIDPASLSPQRRQEIDAAMQIRFDQAAAQGQSPVTADMAQGWLRTLLQAG